MAGWVAVIPADGSKSIIQASYKTGIVGDFAPTFSKVLQQRGISGLYAGFAPAMCRAFPANAALFLGYEVVRGGFRDLDP